MSCSPALLLHFRSPSGTRSPARPGGFQGAVPSGSEPYRDRCRGGRIRHHVYGLLRCAGSPMPRTQAICARGRASKEPLIGRSGAQRKPLCLRTASARSAECFWTRSTHEDDQPLLTDDLRPRRSIFLILCIVRRRPIVVRLPVLYCGSILFMDPGGLRALSNSGLHLTCRRLTFLPNPSITPSRPPSAHVEQPTESASGPLRATDGPSFDAPTPASQRWERPIGLVRPAA